MFTVGAIYQVRAYCSRSGYSQIRGTLDTFHR